MFEQKQIMVNGILINYLMRSDADQDKPVIVFLHGWRLSSAVWLPVLSAFSDFRIVALDLPGFGKSERPRDFFTVEDYADVVRGFLDALGIARVHLVGHSFGGRVAIRFCAAHAHRVDKLVLVDSSGIRFKPFLKRMLAVFVKPLRPVFFLKPLRPVREYFYRAIGADDYLATPELRSVFQTIVQDDVRVVLPLVEAKTLVVWGERDQETPLRVAYIMEKEIPNARLIILKNAGHMSFLDAPQEFERVVLDFLHEQ